MKTSDKTGGIVGALTVHDGDEIMMITNNGQMVRTKVNEIREAGRNTMGVRLINLDKKCKLQGIARVVNEDAETEEDLPADELATGNDASNFNSEATAETEQE